MSQAGDLGLDFSKTLAEYQLGDVVVISLFDDAASLVGNIASVFAIECGIRSYNVKNKYESKVTWNYRGKDVPLRAASVSPKALDSSPLTR